MSAPSPKSVGGALLVAVAVGAVAVGLRREARRSAAEAAESASNASAVEAPRADAVVVYYFHGDQRCATCLDIEAQTKRAIEENFAEQMADAKLRLESVNFEAPGNAHFRKDYDLSFGTVVVQGGGADQPWENLSDVWTLIHDDPVLFEVYIVDHVERMLEPAR